jgi:hypothetical protein
MTQIRDCRTKSAMFRRFASAASGSLSWRPRRPERKRVEEVFVTDQEVEREAPGRPVAEKNDVTVHSQARPELFSRHSLQ